MKYPKWLYKKVPVTQRYWIFVVGSWLRLIFGYVINIPLAIIVCSLAFLMSDLPRACVATWEEHLERLRIYKEILERVKAQGSDSSK